jgi:AAA15 family ATPase/GTPase
MKIIEVKIRNFRSLKNTLIRPQAFNVFVGQNNHGKTKSA